jgi:hypothetical protein
MSWNAQQHLALPAVGQHGGAAGSPFGGGGSRQLLAALHSVEDHTDRLSRLEENQVLLFQENARLKEQNDTLEKVLRAEITSRIKAQQLQQQLQQQQRNNDSDESSGRGGPPRRHNRLIGGGGGGGGDGDSNAGGLPSSPSSALARGPRAFSKGRLPPQQHKDDPADERAPGNSPASPLQLRLEDSTTAANPENQQQQQQQQQQALQQQLQLQKQNNQALAAVEEKHAALEQRVADLQVLLEMAGRKGEKQAQAAVAALRDEVAGVRAALMSKATKCVALLACWPARFCVVAAPPPSLRSASC